MSAPHRVELYGSRWCPHTKDLRDHLEWRGEQFVEYDVEADAGAFERLRQLTDGRSVVPVLVEDGAVRGVGWLGRSCIVGRSQSGGTE
jgi:glutaredoxin